MENLGKGLRIDALTLARGFVMTMVIVIPIFILVIGPPAANDEEPQTIEQVTLPAGLALAKRF